MMGLPVHSETGASGRIDRLIWPVSVCFQAFGVSVRVRSNSPQLVASLGPLLPPGARVLDGERAAEHVLSIWIASRPGRPIRVFDGPEPVARTRSLSRALDVLESRIRLATATHAPDHVFVHAGVIAYEGRAVLVPGRSRSGKTTLVAALVKAGASYLSDELAPLAGDGRVHPFPKPLTIRGPHGCDAHAVRRDAEELGGRSETDALPVSYVILSSYAPGARWSPRTLSPGQAVVELLAHTIPARLRPEASLATLARALAGARVFRGERGNADETARWLLDRMRRDRDAVRGGAA